MRSDQDMFNFGNPQTPVKQEPWKIKLDQFSQKYQQQLAALAWGTYLEQQEQEKPEILGIKLKPTPQFVYCPREAIENLNRQVNGLLQELLGIVDGYKPEQEVVIIAIGEAQIKLINFAPEPNPSVCFEQIAKDTDTLKHQLEQSLEEYFPKSE